MSVLSLVQGLSDMMTQEPQDTGWLEQILPGGRLTPVEQVRHLVGACQLIRQLQAEVELRLENERERTQRALDRLQAPTSERLHSAYQLTEAGLTQHFEALELLALAVSDEHDDLLEEARQLAESADQALDEAEFRASDACQDCPLEA